MAPASLLENWQRELALWCPSLRVAPYFGAARIDLRDELEDWRCGLLPNIVLAIVSLSSGCRSCLLTPKLAKLLWFTCLELHSHSLA